MHIDKTYSFLAFRHRYHILYHNIKSFYILFVVDFIMKFHIVTTGYNKCDKGSEHHLAQHNTHVGRTAPVSTPLYFARQNQAFSEEKIIFYHS